MQKNMSSEKEMTSIAKNNHSKSDKEASTFWKPMLLLIPVRLGLECINHAYVEHLKVSYFGFN